MQLDALTPEAVHERGRLGFGQPRAIRVSRSGHRIALLRAPDARTAEQELWLLERDAGGDWAERRVEAAAAGGPGAESRQAAALRERMRELAGGILEYTADAELDSLVFGAGGALWHFATATGAVHRLDGTEAAEAPLLSPDGRLLAYLSGGAIRVIGTGDAGRVLATVSPADEHETLGRPDFVAAEELHRFEGMWWDPGLQRLLFQRTDERGVPEWTISNPGDPSASPTRVRYPVANGPNAELALAILDVGSGETIPVRWDAAGHPYLCRATWTEPGGLTIDVQTRDQRTLTTLGVDPTTGDTSARATIEDRSWIEPGNGTRDHGPLGELVQLLDVDGTRVVRVGETIVATDVIEVHGSCERGLLVECAPTRLDRRIALVGWDGSREWLSDAEGIAHAWGGGDTVVVEQRTLELARPRTTVHGPGARFEVASNAEPLEWPESVELFGDLADEGSAAALLLPMGYDAGRDGPLPVLLDPYGGPQFARVSRDRHAYVHARWLAEHGYAVLAVDGLGAPGRSPAWERRIERDFTRSLDSQLAGLHEVAERRPGVLDLGAVGIRGWSFGGYLAALAAIRRPDLIRAAAVGAPVSDWTLYDTHYTERYLGVGEEFPAVAERNGLIAAVEAAVAAGRTPSPMLILHGFEDDNVVVAHSIRLAETLTAHQVPHSSILLPSLTHIGRTPALAKLQRLELDFFDRQLRPC